MPARRMWALISGLPEHAAVWRSDKPKWTQQDELAAVNSELLDQIGRRIVFELQRIAAPYYRGAKARWPDALLGRIEHPERPEPSHEATAHRRTRRRMTTAEMKKYFGGRR